jgi:hypothetical protein
MRAIAFFGLLVVAASCGDDARWEEHTVLARSFMQAAAQKDSATLLNLSVDSIPALRARAAANVVPSFVASAATALEFSRGWEQDDADLVEFRVSHQGVSEVVRIGSAPLRQPNNSDAFEPQRVKADSASGASQTLASGSAKPTNGHQLRQTGYSVTTTFIHSPVAPARHLRGLASGLGSAAF